MNLMFDPLHIAQDDARYPSTLRFHLGEGAPATLTVRGNLNILGDIRSPLVALFCSVQCSHSIILQTYELARALRDAGVTVISGFHSPMEKECLLVLLHGSQPVIVCPARSIERLRLPADWKGALRQGRLLLLSPFEEKLRRVTTNRARTRNQLVAALADALLIAHAAPGSKTERLCHDALGWGKFLLTLENIENAGLLALGARTVRPEPVAVATVVASCHNHT
jgi:predicted Rossmann fold nucleotide-binding protein DprA/Smf involved in DNA uptake